MTDAKALSTIRQFMEDYPNEPNQAIINIRFEPTRHNGNIVVAQRIGGDMPAVVRSAATFSEAVAKVFADTKYATE